MSVPMRLVNPISPVPKPRGGPTVFPAHGTATATINPGGGIGARREFLFDNIAEGLTSGRFGGTALVGNLPSALLALLAQMGWDPDVRALAGAMPHVPEAFDVTQFRAVMERLGYTSRGRLALGAEVVHVASRTLVLTPKGEVRLIVPGMNGGHVVRCPFLGEEKPLRPSKKYQIMTFTAQGRGRDQDGKEAWTARLWRRFSREISLLIGLIFLSNMLVIATSLWIMAVFDTAIPAKAPDTLGMFAVGLAGLLALDVWIRRIRAKIIAGISGRLEFILGTALFSKLMSFPVSMLTSASISDQISRLKQFETVRDFFNGPVVAVLLEVPFLLLLLFAIGFISPMLAAISFGFVSLFAVAVVLLYPRISRASKTLSRHRTEHLRLILETLGRRSQIAAMGLSDVWSKRIATSAAQSVDARMAMERHNRILSTLTTAATPLSGGTVLLCGAALVIEGQITGGQLVAVTILVWRLLAPVQQALLVAVRTPELGMLLKQIDALMRIDPNMNAPRSGLVKHLEPRVDVENLVVRYPRAATPALAGVSLQVPAGHMVVVDGPSGGGKSTLLRAIAGQYPAQSGSVQVGGTNIQQIAPQDLAEKIGYITNQSLVFHGTVAQNLFLAAPEARLVELHDIARELGILDQILALPEGFDTRLNHAQQARMTGGLRTMIAAAQVLLRRPGIILFDAPSSPLRPEQESRLIAAFQARRATTTVFLVSANPTVAQSADVRLVLAGGRIQSLTSPQVPK